METVKEVNLVQMEEQYGNELRKYLESDIDYAASRKMNWKLEVINETANFITFAFATVSFAQVYEVSKKRKVVDEKYLIGSVDGKKIVELMDSLKA